MSLTVLQKNPCCGCTMLRPSHSVQGVSSAGVILGCCLYVTCVPHAGILAVMTEGCEITIASGATSPKPGYSRQALMLKDVVTPNVLKPDGQATQPCCFLSPGL